MKKDLTKISKIIILIMLILLVSAFCNNSFASSILNTDNYNVSGELEDNSKALGIISTIINLIQVIGIIISVISISILGIKFMIGSTEQRAEYKKTMIPFIVGVVLIVSATTIVKAISKAVL